MLFFLSHAHRLKLLFDGTRFINVRLHFPIGVSPTFVAAIYNKPRLLLMLLRYGASLEFSWMFNIWKLLRHLIRKSSLGPDFDTWNTSVVSSSVSDVWECLRILLRTVKQVFRTLVNTSFQLHTLLSL